MGWRLLVSSIGLRHGDLVESRRREGGGDVYRNTRPCGARGVVSVWQWPLDLWQQHGLL